MSNQPAQRMNADERRAEVLGAAAAAFAEGGYRGTSTEDIARRAGISQPYIFRLFGSKQGLFVAVLRDCLARTERAFANASTGLSGTDALIAMGGAYQELVRDPAVLLVELHGFTASAQDPVVRAVAREGMRRIWELARTVSGLGPDEVRTWLASGMLLNVVAALGLDQLPEDWATELAQAPPICTDALAPAEGAGARA